MRLSPRSAGALVVLALAAAPLAPAHASADGCVTEYAATKYYMSNHTVTINPDGSVTVDPNPAENLAAQVANRAVWFVGCVV